MSNFSGAQGTEIEKTFKVNKLIHDHPFETQNTVFEGLRNNLAKTIFGREHGITVDSSYTDFVKRVPVRDYEDFNKYLDLVLSDHDDVLWPGKPIFLGTTSATTGVRKYIPVTKDSITSFIDMTLRMVMQYMHDEKDYTLLNHKLINFSGSTAFKMHHNFAVGSISSICRKMLPADLAIKSLPSEEALNKMTTDGWEAMFRLTAHEVNGKPIATCTGLPSWMMQFFKICCEEFNTHDLTKILPHLRLLCTSGVNYRPYLPELQKMFGDQLKVREMYGATEGAFAYQDSVDAGSMLLNLAGGVLFEFIAPEHAHLTNPPRISLGDVQVNKSYVPIISTNSGLWAYRMCDVVKFTSTRPYKISILGRTSHFISIVAEHVYAQVVEDVMHNLSKELNFGVINFTVAPSRMSDTCKPYYDWLIESTQMNDFDDNLLEVKLDYYMKQFSAGYASTRNGGLLGTPRVTFLQPGSFMHYLKQKDQSSLQLKVPKVQNDRNIVDFMLRNNLLVKDGVLQA